MIEHSIIHYKEGQIFNAEVYRKAVRAIIRRKEEILLIHSTNVGDYKFPGGGVEKQEDDSEALRREIKEECGLVLSEIKEKVIRITEMSQSRESETTLFKMISEYYVCTVKTEYVRQQLDEYEEELGFIPIWITLEKAIEQNKQMLKSSNGKRPSWLEREIWVMETMKDREFT
ncbi:MAG: NUDIX domain-containing protein [Candidatus Aegiribacteria sp.]|nr:NUDIX domain-containing protein [Candidatus Aegiribacteria sp.]